jgi:hypothetical protein
VASCGYSDADEGEPVDRSLTLHFNDGSKLSFDFPRQADNDAARQMRLADFMTSKHLVIEAEGSVLIFPINNIKYIALNSPRPDPKRNQPTGLPRHAILGARIIS